MFSSSGAAVASASTSGSSSSPVTASSFSTTTSWFSGIVRGRGDFREGMIGDFVRIKTEHKEKEEEEGDEEEEKGANGRLCAVSVVSIGFSTKNVNSLWLLIRSNNMRRFLDQAKPDAGKASDWYPCFVDSFNN